MAFGNRKNNAQLIADVASLGYLKAEWLILDPTYGLGRFWKLWQPLEGNLVATDNDRDKARDGVADFTNLPYQSNTFDAVVFDPPYKLNGTPACSSDAGYGVDKPTPAKARHALIRDGIREVTRVLKPKGYLLIKCQDQISGGFQWQTREFGELAESQGCKLVDMLHLQSYRPQPRGTRQVHARRDYSTLLVHRKSP